jgi:hypothetical protein
MTFLPVVWFYRIWHSFTLAIPILCKMIALSTSGSDGNSSLSCISFVISENGTCSWNQFRCYLSLLFPHREYKFVRNDRILYFFNNFDDYMNEDAQWMQSEKIKPRQKATSHAWHSSHAFDEPSDIFAFFCFDSNPDRDDQHLRVMYIAWMFLFAPVLWRLWFSNAFFGKNSFLNDHSVVSPLSSASEGTPHSYGTFETLWSLATAHCD